MDGSIIASFDGSIIGSFDGSGEGDCKGRRVQCCELVMYGSRKLCGRSSLRKVFAVFE